MDSHPEQLENPAQSKLLALGISTIFRTDIKLVMQSRYRPHISCLRARAIGVPVRILKMRQQPRHLNRCRAFLSLPYRTILTLLQRGHAPLATTAAECRASATLAKCRATTTRTTFSSSKICAVVVLLATSRFSRAHRVSSMSVVSPGSPVCLSEAATRQNPSTTAPNFVTAQPSQLRI